MCITANMFYNKPVTNEVPDSFSWQCNLRNMAIASCHYIYIYMNKFCGF
jgi:hypothetical protein